VGAQIIRRYCPIGGVVLSLSPTVIFPRLLNT
jgi:hypothetical protein